MMDISTKRFSIKSDGFGRCVIRDRDAPYHPHSVDVDDVPSVHRLAMMTESQFDKILTQLCYGGK